MIAGTELGDPAVAQGALRGRQAGYRGLDGSADRLRARARSAARALRKNDENRIEAPARAVTSKIAKARFAVYGTSMDPNATFTLRLSYGAVKGFPNLSGVQVPSYTTIGGLFERTTDAEPYVPRAHRLTSRR